MLNVSKFYKHILINLLFITISIVAMFFALLLGNQYIASKDSLQKSYLNRSKEISRSIDDKLSSGVHVLNQLSVHPLTQNYLTLKSYDAKLSLDLYKHFSSSVSILPNLEITIGVYNPNLDTVLSNHSTSNLGTFLKKFGLDKNINVTNFINYNFNEGNRLSSSMVLKTSITEGALNKQYLCYLVKKDQVANEPLFFAIYSINSLMSPILSNNAPIDFSIEINTSSPQETDSPMHDVLIESEILPVSYSIAFDSVRSFIFSGHFFKMFFIFILVMLISLFLIYKFANKVYSPVQKLVSSTSDLEESQDIIDEFEYIRSKVENLKSAIHGYNLSGKDMLLKELLYGIKKDNIKDLLINNNIHLFNTTPFMAILCAKKTGPLQLDTPTAKIYVELSLTGVFEHLKEYENYKLINISSMSNILFINKVTRKEMELFFGDLASTLSEYRIILTHPVDLTEVSPKFYAINELLKNDKIGNIDDIVLEEDIIIQARIPYVYSESDKRLIIYNITSANKEELLTLLSNILEENLFNRELAPQVHHEFISAICSTLNSVSPNFKESSELFTLLTNIKDKVELKNAICNIFLEYYYYLNSDDAKKDMKYNFLDYIHNNYDQDISLADMAHEFNLAVNYVGVLFKEKTCYNFKDYLNTYRINVSKQILLNTPNIKIKDLSTSVGFINTNTFIRIFKKYEGMSPGQYQKFVLDTHTEL